MAHIGIIGAGISGLTLALLLREKGHTVRVLEVSDQPGGAIRTTRDRDGWMAEWGPNTIIESSGRIKRLVSMLDLEGRRRYPDISAKKRYIVRDGRMVAVPGSLRELIRTPLLSRSAKLSILREPFRQRYRPVPSSQQTAPPHHSHSDSGTSFHTNDESLAGFVRRRLGEEFLKWPIDALVGGIYAGDPERLSVQHAFPRLALLEEQHGSLILGQIKGGVRRPPESDEIPRNKAEIFSFDDGLQVLPEAISARLGDAVILNSRVAGIEMGRTEAPGSESIANSRWRITFTDPQEPPLTFDSVIYAGTSQGLKSIKMPGPLSETVTPVADILHPPVVSLTLGFHRRDIGHPLDGFGVLVPGIEGFPILGTLFTSTLFPNRAPDEDHVTLTTYLGGTRQPEIAEKSEEEQVKLVLESLRNLLGLRGEPLYRHRILWARAIPQYETGFARYLTLMDRAEHEHPGFYMAGNYRTGISVGDTINAAFDLAERIDQDLIGS